MNGGPTWSVPPPPWIPVDLPSNAPQPESNFVASYAKAGSQRWLQVRVNLTLALICSSLRHAGATLRALS